MSKNKEKKLSPKAKARKEFYDQVHWVANELIKLKQNNSRAYAVHGEDVDRTYDQNFAEAISSVVSTMPKRRLKKLISHPCLNSVPYYSSWRGNNICSSHYSKHPYSCNWVALKEIPQAKNMDSIKSFIGLIANGLSSKARTYPKLSLYLRKWGEGIILYTTMSHQKGSRESQALMVSMLKRSKDARVLRWASKNIDINYLKKYSKWARENNVKISRHVMWNMEERMREISQGSALNSFLKRENALDLSWEDRHLILADFQKQLPSFNPKQAKAIFLNVQDKLGKGVHYSTGNRLCLDIMENLIPYVPHDERVYLLGALDAISSNTHWTAKSLEDTLKELLFDPNPLWDI